jgi:PIN domain nuclease of toxin-antitoxin system
MASIWEIGIKVGLGKLDVSGSVEEFVQEHLHNHLQLLPIRVAHVAGVVALPRHHGDPFDRMLIAQAAKEDLTILTADRAFSSYPVKTLW